MGTVNIVFANTGASPAYKGGALAAENLTSSGTSAQSTNTAPVGCYVRITSDTAGYVKTGSNPTAAVGDEWRLLENQPLDLEVNKGDKVAVIDG